MEKNIQFFLIIGVFIVIAFLLTNGFGFAPSPSGIATQNEVPAEITGDPVLTIATAEITETAQWFEYDDKGTTIKFFAVRASDGSIKTAFDACDVCYGSHKGYRQEGGDMICNNCGNHYAIDGLGTKNKKGGGCWPGYLPSTVEGDNVIIKKSDLEEREWMFE